MTNTSDDIALQIKVYPNPVEDILYVASTTDRVKHLRLYDIQGLIVKDVDANNKLDVSNVHSGTYLLKIETATATASHKIII